MVTLAAIFIRTNGRFTYLALTRATTRCTYNPWIMRPFHPHWLFLYVSHLLCVPHARPVSRLAAHAASTGIGALVPTPSRNCPAEHRGRTGCRSSSVHHALSACNCAPSVCTQPPCPDRRGREPLLVHVTRARECQATSLRARAAAVPNSQSLVDSPSRGASVPQECPVERGSDACWLGAQCQEVSGRSGWGLN